MEFYYIENNKQRGPVTIEELEKTNINPQTMVWCEGMPDWKKAGDVSELTEVLQFKQQQRYAPNYGAVPPPMPPQQPPYYEPRQAYGQTPPQPQPRKSHIGLIAFILIFMALFITMINTVPDRQAHVDKIGEVTRDWLGDQTEDMGTVWGGLVKWITGRGADAIIDQALTVDNYFVCSVGKFTFGNNSKTVSLGILGHVFTFGKRDVEDAVRKAMSAQQSQEEQNQPDEEYIPPYDEADPGTDPGIIPDETYPDETPNNDEPSAADEILDSLANRAKDEAIKSVKNWAKKQIDNF
ncbi:MAG: DUF4339 domain-containing protein [Bacteroidales bacterium]|nr:DUF4339 domain-containing protein [Candidatus Sodaliphilus aphodohippi]